MIYEWFDELWEAMIKFIRAHPRHIVFPADNPKEFISGFLAVWDHPQPGIFAHELGIDISDIELEEWFEIRMRDYLKSKKCGRIPKEISNLDYFTQTGKLKIAKRIVQIARS